MVIKHHKPTFLEKSKASLNYNAFAQEYSDAIYALGLLEGSQKQLQNPSLLISPLTAKEATISSKIEGTLSTVSDVFLYEAGGKPAHSDTIQVVNYRMAMNHALSELKNRRTITSHFIESLHAILLRGVGPKAKTGKYRSDTVYIAKPGDSIDKASYIPPEFHLVRDYMDNLVDYIQKNADGALIKAGVAHYQFEAIHPFHDGNGRLGRLLIPLILFNEKKLSSPILYLSGYFEANRDQYISTLKTVDETGKLEVWLSFFLRCVAEQLKVTQRLIEDIYSLYRSTKDQFQITNSPYHMPFVDFIFEFPYFTIPFVLEKLPTDSYITVQRCVKYFKEQGVIQDSNMRSSRAKIYLFKPLLDLLQ